MAAPKIILISGTFMNVGKSTLTKGIARNLIKRGKKVVAIKPVETECETTSEDGASYAAVTGQTRPKHALIRLHPHGVPPLAALVEGVTIDFDALVEDIKDHAKGSDIAFVESMGGLCTPITWKPRPAARSVRPRGSSPGNSASATSAPITATCAPRRSSSRVKKRPRSMPRSRISGRAAPVPLSSAFSSSRPPAVTCAERWAVAA